MIRFVQGDLLQAPAEALVNTVNTVGVMERGWLCSSSAPSLTTTKLM
ncbi:hypothetical protein [Thermus sp.]|nr:hypothetical protein [Thermus sp.]MDW8358125.1 hypothetical protein [Thermus sp.]